MRQGEERISRKGKPYKVVLQAAHLDHNDRHNPNAVLICLCFRCHWWHDFEQWVLEQERRLNDLKHRILLEKARAHRAKLKRQAA